MAPCLPENEVERLKYLRQSRVLDTAPEDAFDDLTRLAAQVCGVPIAAVSLIDEERQWFKSVVGLPYGEKRREDAFCAQTILQSDTMIVADAVLDDRFKDNPQVTGDPHIRFYAGAPLITSEGFALGSLCIVDRVPRQITEQQRLLLEVLARQVAGRIEMQRRAALQEELLAQWNLAERRLSVSEERLLFAVESSGIGTWLWDVPSNILTWSERCKALFGLPPDAVVTREQLYETMNPEDRDRTRQAVAQSLAERTVYDTEYRIVWADGSEHWIAARGRGYYGDDGQPVRFEGTVQNIDARKSAETTLREAAERQRTLLRDVLASVTGGRLRLVENAAELPPPLTERRETVLLTLTEGLRTLRHSAQAAAEELGFSEERSQDLVTAVSECGMNAVTHGGGQGEAVVSLDMRGVVQLRVQDWGTGINMENLPKATLSRGWSSTTSLGHGLVMMLQSVDRLWLLTGISGTTVVLEQDREEPPPAWL